MEVEPLSCLLDVTTANDISARFTDIADALLKNSHLVFGEIAFELLEIEFYLSSARHKDPFTHGNEEQSVTGQWYFHRASTSGTAGFRGGTRKGLDLTFGPAIPLPYFDDGGLDDGGNHPDEGTRGGILIRSIRRVDDGKVTSGPSRVVDTLLNVADVSSIPAFLQVSDASAFTEPGLFIRPCPALDVPIYQSPRIGLDLERVPIGTTAHPRITFLPKRYRFFTHPHLLASSSRPYNFVGVFDSIDECTPGAVAAHLGPSPTLTTLKRYIDAYVRGKTSGSRALSMFSGPRAKGHGRQVERTLTMLGACAVS